MRCARFDWFDWPAQSWSGKSGTPSHNDQSCPGKSCNLSQPDKSSSGKSGNLLEGTAFNAVLLILGHFECSVVTSITFGSNLINFGEEKWEEKYSNTKNTKI